MADMELEDGSRITVPDDATPEQAQDYLRQAQSIQRDMQMGNHPASPVGKPTPTPTAQPSLWDKFTSNLKQSFSPQNAYDYFAKPVSDLLGPNVDQGKQMWQALTGQGDFSKMSPGARGAEAVAHGLGAITPVIGPAAVQMGSHIGQGQYGPAALDAGGIAASEFGPEIMSGLTKPLRQAGKNMLFDLLKLNPETKTPKPEEVLNLAKELGTLDKGKIQDFINTNKAGAAQEIAKNPNLRVPTSKAMGPLLQSVQEDDSAGFLHSSAAQRKLDELQKFVQKWGPDIPLDKAQEVKQYIWKQLSDKNMQKALVEQPGAKQALFLQGHGIKEAMEDVVGPTSNLADFNHKAHVGLSLYNAVDKMTNEQRSTLLKYLPTAAGAASLAGAHFLGHAASPLVEAAGYATAPAATYFITKSIMKEPTILSGIAMNLAKAGEGPLSQMVAQLPKLMLAESQRSKQIMHTAPVVSPKVTPGPAPAPKPTAELDVPKFIQDEAKRQGLDPNLALAVAHQESQFDPKATSGKGARGIFQLMPGTAKMLGVNPDDPKENIQGGVRYLKQMMDRYKDVPTALAAYNWGPEHVDRGGDLPAETQNYISQIMGKL